MDDEIEDVVGEVKLTESQKSVAVSNVYSLDFTDSSSERHNSSGMETYVLEWDSEDSDASALQTNVSTINMKDRPAKPVLINTDAQSEFSKKITKSSTSSTSTNKCSIYAQEIFTQTSKTIIELAENEGAVRKPVNSKTLETQTSFISIIENKTYEYRIEMSGTTKNFSSHEVDVSGLAKSFSNNEIEGYEPTKSFSDHEIEVSESTKSFYDHEMKNVRDDDSPDDSCNLLFPNSLDDHSSKFLKSSETENEKSDDCASENSSEGKIINIFNDESKENITSEEQNEYENTSDFEQSLTDIEEDSLMEPKCKVNKSEDRSEENISTPKSVDRDVAELYSKLYESIEFQKHVPGEHEKRRFGYLTPLTEESVPKKESSAEIVANNLTRATEEDNDVLFTNNAGIKVKLFPKSESNKETDSFKLPPIQGNHVNAEGGNLNFLFSVNQNKVMKPNNLSVHEERRDRNIDRWEIGNKDLAAGESPQISGRSESDRISHASVQLPPIHAEGYGSKTEPTCTNSSKTELPASESQCSINIKDKIKELKMSHKPRSSWSYSKYNMPRPDSRSNSPSSGSPDDSKVIDAAERGCELLCVDLIKRLRSHSWFEVADTLDDIPRVLEKFWSVITEHRVADLIRQVTAQVESPRTQVARTACNTLATILKNTNYTKKPDFYEAVAVLLNKTGSFSRPIRRAANVALDDIVCGVDLSHSVTALCIHGTSHKSALVRCAAARLLVVCCALGGGGRDLLRARPPSAACARKHALRSLSTLLDDKSADARKYAERLYSMLRPLSNFEAYYLTDVDVELASKQMKKYDQLLLCGPPESR